MRPRTADDVLELLDSAYLAASVGAALELGLFERLAERPHGEREIAAALGIPLNRCRYWLQLIERTGLVERTVEGYAPSATAKQAILDPLPPASWAQLAVETREALPGLNHLAIHLRAGGSAFDALGFEPPDYLALMRDDPARARRFTRMLYEIHRDFAERLAESLDLGDADRVLDLGGGSGVVSLALARRHPRLTALVLDLENVCVAGREIAAEAGLSERVAYRGADLLADELPGGFDAVLECDVNAYDEALFRRVLAALRPAGRLFVVDQFAPAEGVAPASRVTWALDGSMRDPSFAFPTAGEVRATLERAGFSPVSARPLAGAASVPCRFARDYTILEAHAPDGR